MSESSTINYGEASCVILYVDVPNLGHMIRRSFLLAHVYCAPLEIYHITSASERNSDDELRALIEWSVRQGRRKYQQYDLRRIMKRGQIYSTIEG